MCDMPSQKHNFSEPQYLPCNTTLIHEIYVHLVAAFSFLVKLLCRLPDGRVQWTIESRPPPAGWKRQEPRPRQLAMDRMQRPGLLKDMDVSNNIHNDSLTLPDGYRTLATTCAILQNKTHMLTLVADINACRIVF